MALGGTLTGVTIHRFFLPENSFQAGHVRCPETTSRQILRVLRLRPGDHVGALDGTGCESIVRLTEVGTEVRGIVERRGSNRAEPAARLALYQALVKGPKLETILQKCTELGVSRFIPVASARSIPGDLNPGRVERFGRIVREAAEQSQRGRVPAIEPQMTFADALERAAAEGPTVFLWEGEEIVRVRDLALSPGSAVSLFVGPEGGFAPDEAEAARAAGARVATLGPRILRAETAAIAGSALVLARMGDLG